MSQQELLTRVVTSLQACGIASMATGSIVSSLQGEPRMSHDIDLVVHLGPQHVTHLLAAFPAPDFYLSEADAQSAIRHQQMFNLLAPTTGERVNFWLQTDEPFDRSRFARRTTLLVDGVPLVISTAEDTILSKLRWARLAGGSEKQHQDALRVYEPQFELLDLSYLDEWAAELDLADLLARVRAEAQVV